MTFRRCATLLAGTLVTAVAPPPALTAQVLDTILSDTLLLHAVLAPPYTDTLRVSLQKRTKYHIAVWPPATAVEAIPVDNPRARAFVPRILLGTGQGPTILELYPRKTAVHVLGFITEASDTVHFWLWAETEAGVKLRKQKAEEFKAEQEAKKKVKG